MLLNIPQCRVYNVTLLGFISIIGRNITDDLPGCSPYQPGLSGLYFKRYRTLHRMSRLSLGSIASKLCSFSYFRLFSARLSSLIYWIGTLQIAATSFGETFTFVIRLLFSDFWSYCSYHPYSMKLIVSIQSSYVVFSKVLNKLTNFLECWFHNSTLHFVELYCSTQHFIQIVELHCINSETMLVQWVNQKAWSVMMKELHTYANLKWHQ